MTSMTICKATLIRRTAETVAGELQATLQGQTDSQAATVAAMLKVGALLVELRPLMKRGWLDLLAELGLTRRVARLLMEAAAGALDRDELVKSGMAHRLPQDPARLAEVARLRVGQLPELLRRLDVQKASKRKISDAVREILGEKPIVHEKRKVCLSKVASKHLEGLLAVADQLSEPSCDDATREAVEQALRNSLHVIQFMLKRRTEADEAA